ncbi:helix-turn-helix domain-containing protein [Haloterrigena alkaliphila]|uniref:Winged helix-turn-helix transcriptional regulator n=1 Tax=Haloterrigena alkaliphila TaxID=2816475 RepID=A0A8A2VF82_9EURY|nr:helix-turn-helix domain-containing protein [Haloterrigena alkaliphila]QSW99064.1 winged helix-turn-helix transcriptional regulator [Haloterrigena alkaliphila]
MVPDDTDEHRIDDGRGEYRDETDTSLEEEIESLEDDENSRTGAVEEVDGRIVDLLSWILDTETRAKIYVHLLANPGSTSEEVATGTGLYPSTVREALAELHDEERVTREKRASEGAGNNPYEYTAIQPSELVGGVVDQVQQELNTIFTLDRILDRRGESGPALEGDSEPVTITVDDTGSVGRARAPGPDAGEPADADESAITFDDGAADSDGTDVEPVDEDDAESRDSDR